MKTVMTKIELGPKEAVKRADVRASDGHSGGNSGVVSEAFSKNLVKVVAHFGFEQNGFINLEAETRAHAGEVGFCLREMKIVSVNAGLNVIVLGKRSRREADDAKDAQKK